MRLIRESIIVLKNWLKILLRLIREGGLYPSLYGTNNNVMTYKLAKSSTHTNNLQKVSLNFPHCLLLYSCMNQYTDSEMMGITITNKQTNLIGPRSKDMGRNIVKSLLTSCLTNWSIPLSASTAHLNEKQNAGTCIKFCDFHWEQSKHG